MDMRLSEEQTQLQDMAIKFMDNECSPEFVRKIEKGTDGYCPEMWKQFAEMGWLGINLPDEHGGMGMGTLDLVILIKELGRHVCPSPFLYTCVLAGDLIAQVGTEEQKSTLIPEIAEGKKIYAFAYQEYSRFFKPEHIKMEAKADGDDFVLNGTKYFCEFAANADTLVVVARTSGAESKEGLTVFLVDAKDAGISTKHMPTMARDRQYEVEFKGVRVAKANVLGTVDNGWADLEPTLNKTALAFSAYTVGAGLEMHEQATEYARIRVQFDRPIGQMQTIQMYLAQMIIELYGADTLTLFTAFNMDKGRYVRGYVAKAKVFSANTIAHVADVGSQIFGGMGYMEEQDTTLYLRRGKQYQLTLGGTEYWEDVIAEEIFDVDEQVVLS